MNIFLFSLLTVNIPFLLMIAGCQLLFAGIIVFCKTNQKSRGQEPAAIHLFSDNKITR
ncbi:hypothetical protein CHCC20441_3184 [Bacillus licheniformis]|uniref:Uncharacterized protein n=1 Tax=Bacillus licheniformis TaxID=1402 RepID=A0A8B5Y6P8_BACLI|nr:hypothetical protein B4164_1438 [Bacillus licheniformis]TWJ36084.1 hypothetical protein CHCC5026_3291 [Bacillus licheniformis]TWK05611.1 hypothetical protein CHCC20441_3184 [Bacillus licheniformis]TWK19101.1 hypothetical protein CHCC20440_1037 [Bacillus licheniformis]TWK54754.1 hypothetical protein CHCC20343_1412 [Bacillus licheniformis]